MLGQSLAIESCTQIPLPPAAVFVVVVVSTILFSSLHSTRRDWKRQEKIPSFCCTYNIIFVSSPLRRPRFVFRFPVRKPSRGPFKFGARDMAQHWDSFLYTLPWRLGCYIQDKKEEFAQKKKKKKKDGGHQKGEKRVETLFSPFSIDLEI